MKIVLEIIARLFGLGYQIELDVSVYERAKTGPRQQLMHFCSIDDEVVWPGARCHNAQVEQQLVQIIRDVSAGQCQIEKVKIQ